MFETKISLSPFDDKRYIMPNSKHYHGDIGGYPYNILRFMYFIFYTYFNFYILRFMYFMYLCVSYTYFLVLHFTFHIFYSLHFVLHVFYILHIIYIVHFAFYVYLQILCIL